MSTSSRPVVKWIVRIVAVLLVLSIAIPGVVVAGAAWRFDKLSSESLAAPASLGFEPVEGSGAEVVAEAERLFRSRGCADCHGLAGDGRQFMDDPDMGAFIGANITSGAGGLPSTYGPAEFDAAVRHCVGHESTRLFFMPCRDYMSMGDRDLAMIWSHVQRLAPMDATPASEPTLLARVLVGAGIVPWFEYDLIDHVAARQPMPEVGPTVAYGEYMSGACVGCHGQQFSGGPLPGAPPSVPVPQNLTPHESGLAGWTYDQFAAAVRTGVRPDGTEIDPFMPAENSFGLMTDLEMQALWAFMQSLPPVAEGNR